ncbi:MAG: helix-hairpin-helix domain-containing protein [Sedimentisphaerales bacterium]|nr:helix-hairpin-helix domain-containing protein [Sedimentisphaerales bacterium]
MNRIPLFAFVVAAGIAVAFCLCFALVGVAADDKAGTIELERRINPNDAPLASLMRLPGVGLAKANAIVEYRRQFQQTCPEQPVVSEAEPSRRNNQGDLAFQDCNDLDNVRGIGPSIAAGMCQYLKFGGE